MGQDNADPMYTRFVLGSVCCDAFDFSMAFVVEVARLLREILKLKITIETMNYSGKYFNVVERRSRWDNVRARSTGMSVLGRSSSKEVVDDPSFQIHLRIRNLPRHNSGLCAPSVSRVHWQC